MICAERSGVFPLRIGDAIAFADRHPSPFASGARRSLICFSKPRNNTRRFRPMALPCFVVVGKRAIKRVEPWREVYRNVIAAMSRIRVVHTAVVFRPFLVP